MTRTYHTSYSNNREQRLKYQNVKIWTFSTLGLGISGILCFILVMYRLLWLYLRMQPGQGVMIKYSVMHKTFYNCNHMSSESLYSSPFLLFGFACICGRDVRWPI